MGWPNPNEKSDEFKNRKKKEEIENLIIIIEKFIFYHKEFFKDSIKSIKEIIKITLIKKLSGYKALYIR